MASIEIKCPQCGAGKSKITFVQKVTETWTIEGIEEDGEVVLGDVIEQFPDSDDGGTLSCGECGHEFSPCSLIPGFND